MSVARVTEIKSSSTKSFDDAIKQGIARANKTLKNVKSARKCLQFDPPFPAHHPLQVQHANESK